MSFGQTELCISRSETFKRPVAEVFRVAETYPIFVRGYDVREVLLSSPVRLHVRVGRRVCGIPFRWEGIGEKEPNRAIRFIQTQGLLRGLRAEWTFCDGAEGTTEFNLTVRLQCSRFWQGVFRRLVASTVKMIVDELDRELRER